MENTEKNSPEPQGEDNNPWGEKYQKSVPEFRGEFGDEPTPEERPITPEESEQIEDSPEREEMTERINLRKESEEIVDLYYEISQTSACTEAATTFAEDFGLDFLAKRYGIANVMEKVIRFSQNINSYDVASSDRGVYEIASDHISEIYQSIEPDADKRKALFREMTSTSENDEDAPRKMRIQSNLYMADNGEIKIMRSGKSGELTGHQAWDGMRNMVLLAEHMTGKTENTVFADITEAINGENRGFKNLPEKASNAAEMLTDGVDNLGFDDLAIAISKRLSRKVDVYEDKVKNIQEKTRIDAAELERRSKFELYKYNAPREETKKKIEALRENVSDASTLRTLDEAIASINELMTYETQQMNAKLESDINHYYYSIINGGKDGLDSHAQAIDKLKRSARYLGRGDK